MTTGVKNSDLDLWCRCLAAIDDGRTRTPAEARYIRAHPELARYAASRHELDRSLDRPSVLLAAIGYYKKHRP